MSPKRTAILKAIDRLGISIPDDLIDDLDSFEEPGAGSVWTILLPPSWKSLEVAVQEDFGTAWDGPNGIVVGEHLAGDLVCMLVGPDGQVTSEVHLLRAEDLSIERAADDLAGLIEGEGGDALSEEDLPPMTETESAGLAAALGRLLGGSMDEPEPEPEVSPALAASIGKALDALVLQELVELEPGQRQPLIDELCASTGEARTPKALVRRFVRCLVESDHPEEVYGTDAELESAVRNAWS